MRRKGEVEPFGLQEISMDQPTPCPDSIALPFPLTYHIVRLYQS